MNTGGPAFPLAASTGDPRDGVYCQNGMSLLDYMAGQALVSLSVFTAQQPHATVEDVAGDAYDLAEAMLAEKARRENESDSGIRTAQSDDEATVEYVIADSSTGTRMAKLEALNRELAEVLEAIVEFDEGIYVPTGSVLHNERSPVLAKAHAALAKAKEVA